MAESILLYGSSGTSKTSQCAEFHTYQRLKALKENSPLAGYPGLHVTGDSSFEPLVDVIAEGICRPWNLAYETGLGSSPISAMMALAGGMMPRDLNLQTGQRLSNEWIPMVGPLSVEGLHVIAESFKYHLMGKGMINTQVVDGQTNLGTAHLAIYDIIKNNIHTVIQRLRGLQYCPRFMWTSHEAKGTDQASASVIGPAILVNKGIDKVPGWFANTFHIVPFSFQKSERMESGRLVYFEPHQDQTTQLFWPAKTSLTPRRLQALKSRSLQVGGNGSSMPCVIADDGSIQGGLAEILKIVDGQI